MHQKARLIRYLLTTLLILLSLVPQVILLPVLGDINLLFLCVLWGLLLICFLKAPLRVSLGASILGAIAMAITPMPYYVGVSNSGVPYFHTLDWKSILEDVYGTSFFFVWHLAFFAGVACLLGRRQRQSSSPS